MTAPLESAAPAGFAGSRARFETVLGWLESASAGPLEPAELEAHLQADARELVRQLYQDHLDLRAEREPRIAAVADAEGVGHGSAEPGHTRGLATVFGQVKVTRIAYRAQPATTWWMASVVADAAFVVGRSFDEAERRDPEHQRTWVALLDRNNHQIDRIGAEARAREVSVRVVIDLIHVLEYRWKAAWCFHAEGDPAAAAGVRQAASAVLDGKSTRVAGAIRRAATMAELDRAKRAGADTCATYLTNKSRYLDYPTALAKGRPIATGVSHRRRRPPPGQRPDGPHRRPLGTQRCRGHPQAPRASQHQRLRRLLALPPRPGTPPTPPRPPVPLRRPRHPACGVRPLQKSRTRTNPPQPRTWAARS
jgi:hypothetical protein